VTNGSEAEARHCAGSLRFGQHVCGHYARAFIDFGNFMSQLHSENPFSEFLID
jgi:hypothetical protein